MRRSHTLRARLFRWFLGAIVLAMATSGLVAFTARPESVSGADAMARNVALRLAETWDDPQATRAFVGEVRDVTGFDVRLVTEPRRLPAMVRHVADRGGAIAPAGPQHIFVPVVREGALAGALEMDRFGVRPAAWGWWRPALTLLLVVGVLSAMAGAVANQLARPLERLAEAADRFGGGDLAFRTEVSGGRRWVAREVQEVAVSFNRMADRVEAMVRGQRELLGAISHELRSPLGRARVALEIARDRLPASAGSSEARVRTPRPTPSAGSSEAARSPAGALDDIEKELRAVDAILGDLLDVTRAGLSDLHKETRGVAEWVRARVSDEPASPPIAVDVADDVRDLALPIDTALLGRALHNLLVNARAHGQPVVRKLERSESSDDTPETDTPQIDVRVTRFGDGARVAVRDRGPGFAEGFAQRAFEPFVRGDPSRARPSSGAGYGLGLAIVRRIVEAHGGSVFARNWTGPGEGGAGESGAEVGFDLPASHAPR